MEPEEKLCVEDDMFSSSILSDSVGRGRPSPGGSSTGFHLY